MNFFAKFMEFLGFKSIEPPEADFFYALYRIKYQKDVLDCSNKTKAYYDHLKSLGYDCTYYSVKYPFANHAILQCKYKDMIMFLDVTGGKVGLWSDLKYPINGIRSDFGNPYYADEYDTTGFSFEDYKNKTGKFS